MSSPRLLLFLDLDDCAAGSIWPFADRPRQPLNREAFAKLMAECEQARVGVHLLTNRPPAQLAVIGHIVGGPARYHLAESGCSAWLPDENRVIINPQCRAFAEEVRPDMVALLRDRLAVGLDGPILEEYGNRLVTYTVFPLQGGHEQVAGLVGQVRELLAGYPVDVRQGKGVDVMPAGMDKVLGCWWAERLHPHLQGSSLDWTTVLYVEDSMTGARAAQYVMEQSGQVAAVANAQEDFRQLVAAGGGILCEQGQEEGTLEALRRWLDAWGRGEVRPSLFRQQSSQK